MAQRSCDEVGGDRTRVSQSEPECSQCEIRAVQPGGNKLHRLLFCQGLRKGDVKGGETEAEGFRARAPVCPDSNRS